MKRSVLAALVVGCLLAVAGCGSAHHAHARCPAGRSFMGCASGVQHTQPATLPHGRLSVMRPVRGCKFPDVSDWQGHPDWTKAAPHICAAVAKAGEATSEDPDFAYNVQSLRRLHVPWAGYWFVRGCNEGAAFVAALNSVGFRGDRDALRPVLDMEVPAAGGCAVPLADAVHRAFGVWPVIYTAPGTWPGGASGGLPVWEADYSSTLAPLPFGARVLAWQRWSPPYSYYYLPGIGYGDVSLDLRGFVRSFAYPPPARPVCFGPGAQHTKTCQAARARVAGWQRDVAANHRVSARLRCPANEDVLAVLWQREHWFAGRLRRFPHVKTAHRRVAVAATRRAISREQALVRQRRCGLWTQRAGYFAAQITKLEKSLS